VTAYGDLGDPSSAIWLLSNSNCNTTRTWNVALGALAKSVESEDMQILYPSSSDLAQKYPVEAMNTPNRELAELLDSKTALEAVRALLDTMSGNRKIDGMVAPPPSSQTFCIAASALQHGPTDGSMAIDMFRNATSLGIPADGRFVNAVIRCFGDDINAALKTWKDEIRPKCLAYEHRKRPGGPPSTRRPQGKNLIAAYPGLFYVCGRALRPDIALRLAYAMSKEGLEPNENTLNSYRSGKQDRQAPQGAGSKIARRLGLTGPYESLLYVECTKYDQKDKRRAGEKRVRIIV
jgi:hypothetical protein